MSTQGLDVGLDRSWLVQAIGAASLRWVAEPALVWPCHQVLFSHAPCERWGHLSQLWGKRQFSHEGRSQFSYCSVQQGAGLILPGPLKGGTGSGRHMIWMTPCGNIDLRHQRRMQLQQDYWPRHDPWQQWGLEDTTAPGGTTGHSDQHGSGGRVALRHQQGHLF